jgi:hypothetical protein
VEERRKLKDKQALLLLSLLFALLFLAWGPWFVYSTLTMFFGYDNWTVFMIIYWIAYSTSMFHPFLFNITNPEMRQAIYRILHCGRVKRNVAVFPRVVTDPNKQLQSHSAQRSTGLVTLPL